MWPQFWKTGLMWLVLAAAPAGCVSGRYTPLDESEKTEVEQLKENVYRVEYRASAFTPQDRLDLYLRRRCAELTLREGYTHFRLAQRADILGFSRRTAMTVTLYKDRQLAGVVELYDAKDVLAGTAAEQRQVDHTKNR